MEDVGILELYRNRSEDAIRETERKYGKYGLSVALGILGTKEDAEECVNDALMRVWDTIPPKKPDNLRVYLGKIIRNLSIDRYRALTSKKRGGGQTTVSFEEAEQFVTQIDTVEDRVREDALMHSISEFLLGQKKLYRVVFVQKYWYFLTVRQIAERNGISESKVLSILHRLRLRLKDKLGKEGYTV